MELITIKQVCKLLAYSESKLYKLVHAKKIEYVKLFNGGIRFKKETIYNMIEKNTVKPNLY
ncbi:MAG: hypothetical protein A2287_04765 [Candidatus Melainabacteria bacterium RIFOXYA12_FULL_32_12]|nr:MAG: hypothetical protein A2287_04765 [Candidatus Melainabacteria bacterium RIFOXYA12_FULL_32_12]